MKLKATLLFIIAMRIGMIMSVKMLHAAHKRNRHKSVHENVMLKHLQEKLHEKTAKVKVARFHITSLNLLLREQASLVTTSD